MLRLSVRAGAMVLAFCLLSLAAKGVGVFVRPPGGAMLQPYECTPGPCWHNISLGVTTVQEAANLLESDPSLSLVNYNPADTHVCWRWQNEWHHEGLPDWDGCYSSVPGAQGRLVLTYEHSLLRLGDMLPLFGDPLMAELCKGYDMGFIRFDKNVSIAVKVPAKQTNLNPDFVVEQVVYDNRFGKPPTDAMPRLSAFTPWIQAFPGCFG